MHLGSPQIGPDVGVVVDVADEGGLAANGRSAGQDAASGGVGCRGSQFSGVAVMRHDRQVLACLLHLFEEPEQVVRVRIGEETIGPVGGGFGPQAYADQVFKLGGEQRFQVASQHSRLHDQGVPSGEEHAGDLPMLLQVVHQLFGLLGGELQLVHAHELGPAKAVGAVGVAGLALAGKEEHGLPILVLHSRERFLAQSGDVELHLSGGMGIESVLDLAGCRIELLGRGVAPDQFHHSGEILAIQHASLWECQLVDGVVGNVLPADQLFDNIAVDAKRQHRRHGLYA